MSIDELERIWQDAADKMATPLPSPDTAPQAIKDLAGSLRRLVASQLSRPQQSDFVIGGQSRPRIPRPRKR